MKSRTTDRFWKSYDELPVEIKEQGLQLSRTPLYLARRTIECQLKSFIKNDTKQALLLGILANLIST
jgi:hypothetical protein